MNRRISIYTDGASRGNPGPGAVAYLIVNEKGELIAERAEFIGACTNNIAEYKALIAGLKAAEKLGGSELTCFSDSQLMISQMKGEFKVKKGHLKELFEEAKTLEKKFMKVEYVNVRRTDPVIQKADRMVNYVMDSMSRFRK
ncbi:MAG: ribonuclease HI family protein [Candidatus Aenigmatarchaeota archaeon]